MITIIITILKNIIIAIKEVYNNDNDSNNNNNSNNNNSNDNNNK